MRYYRQLREELVVEEDASVLDRVLEHEARAATVCAPMYRCGVAGSLITVRRCGRAGVGVYGNPARRAL